MTWTFIKARRYSFNLIFSIVLILVLGIVVSVYSGRYAQQQVKSSLLERTTIISSVLDMDDIVELTGSEIDKDFDYYKILKVKLSKLAKINSDVRFVYLTGMRDGKVFFYADSEPDDSIYSSPPGQIYGEASDIFKSVFVDKVGKLEGPSSDRWGSWISALSPIINHENSEVVAVVGIDINSNEYYRSIIIYTSIPLLIALLISSFIYFIYKMYRKEDDLLALKSELVSIAAHDLRTPLVGLKWSLDLLNGPKNDNLNHSQKETFKQMRSTSSTLLDTANQILEASKLEKQNEKALQLEKSNVVEIIDEIKDLYLFSTKEKNIKIEYSPNFPKDIEIICDKSKIKRVFSNLVSNAIKYSPADKKIIFDYKQTSKTHIISIQDQGIGIPEKDFQKIFREYYRADNSYQMSYGTGLGLYYVKRVIELHKGKITFESKEGEGTTFFIELNK